VLVAVEVPAAGPVAVQVSDAVLQARGVEGVGVGRRRGAISGTPGGEGIVHGGGVRGPGAVVGAQVVDVATRGFFVVQAVGVVHDLQVPPGFAFVMYSYCKMNAVNMFT